VTGGRKRDAIALGGVNKVRKSELRSAQARPSIAIFCLRHATKKHLTDKEH
jgi:hypothetical protein